MNPKTSRRISPQKYIVDKLRYELVFTTATATRICTVPAQKNRLPMQERRLVPVRGTFP